TTEIVRANRYLRSGGACGHVTNGPPGHTAAIPGSATEKCNRTRESRIELHDTGRVCRCFRPPCGYAVDDKCVALPKQQVAQDSGVVAGIMAQLNCGRLSRRAQIRCQWR